MKNQERKIRPEIISIYGNNNPIFYPFSIKINKSSGNCNDINDPYARICIPDVIKNLSIRIFNLMTRTNETRHIEWHEKCKCEWRSDRIICNNKQYWNKDKCRCEYRKLVDKDVCDKGFIWNPSTCKCECDKSCNNSEYLDYLNCECKKKLVDKLIDECTQNINETKLVEKTLDKNENKKNYEHNSCSLYYIDDGIFTVFTGITVYLIYHNSSLINNNISCIKFNNKKIRIKK